jgi:formylglycine-generating enzyme required for sulfatase activity
MNRARITVCLMAAALFGRAGLSSADTFGTGDNQFTIDFVTISGATNPTSGYGIVNYDYRMGVYEITNSQWSKFLAEHGKPSGSPSNAYDDDPYFTGADVATNRVSWYEAAQFVNWLNIEAGKTAAYKFTGTPGTGSYALGVWDASEAWDGTNLYRHKDAYYFLPTEDEWVKAAYWNGTSLQTYATKPGESLHQGDGIIGTGWNYMVNWSSLNYNMPWNVGSGSEELNGTYDMMGNVREWMENPYYSGYYSSDSFRGIRGGAYITELNNLASSNRYSYDPVSEVINFGFRVASIPEPGTVLLLSLGSLGLVKRRRKA